MLNRLIKSIGTAMLLVSIIHTTQSMAQNPYEYPQPENQNEQALDESPLKTSFEHHMTMDLEESVFDKKKKQPPITRKNGGNPPVPISDHLEILIIGGIVLMALFHKKLFVQQ